MSAQVQQSPAPSSSQSAPQPSAPTSAGAASQVQRRALVGKSLAEQEAMLAPVQQRRRGDAGAGAGVAAVGVVQREASDAASGQAASAQSAGGPREKLLQIAARARQPGRDARYDAWPFVYKMLESFLPEVGAKYHIAGVTYEEAEKSIRVDMPNQGRDILIVVGKDFVVGTNAANFDAQVATLRDKVKALETSAGGMLGDKITGAELASVTASFSLAAGAIVESFWADVEVPAGGASVRLTLTPTHMRVDVSPHLYIDGPGADAATFHGFTYRFDDAKGGIVDIKEGQDIRKAGLAGPISDEIVSRGATMLRDLLMRLTQGSCFARPGFNPLGTAKDELLAGVEKVKANFQQYKSESGGGDEEAEAGAAAGGQQKDETKDEGYGLDKVSNVGLAANIVYQPGYKSMDGGMGVTLDPGAQFSVSLQTSGTAADLGNKGIDGAKLQQLAVTTPSGVGLWYGGQRIASLNGVTLKRGQPIRTNVVLNPTADLVATIRKEHPSWFTESIDDTLNAVDATLLPFSLILWGMGGDAVGGTSGKQPDDKAVRNGVVSASVAYLQGLAEWEASAIAKAMFLDNADLLASSLGITRAQLMQFTGIASMPGGGTITALVQAVKSAGAGKESIGHMVDAFKSMAVDLGDNVSAVVGLASEAGGAASSLAKDLQADFNKLKQDVASLGKTIDAIKKDAKAIGDAVDGIVDGAKAIGEVGGALVDGASALGDLWDDLAGDSK